MIPDIHQFRDRRHFIAAVLSEMLALPMRVGARAIVGRAPSPPHAWRSGLILGNGHIGDTLYRTCSLDALARALPECRWTYLTTAAGAAVLEGNPALAEILPWMPGSEADSALATHARELRSRRFDVALCTENVRHHATLLMAVRLGIPNRVAFTDKGFSGLTTLRVSLRSAMSRPAQFRRMVEAISGMASGDPIRPRVYLTRQDQNDAAYEWQRLFPEPVRLVIACAITTRQSIGAFPPELFRAILSRALTLDSDVRVLLLGSAGDRAVLDSLANKLGNRARVSSGTVGIRAVVGLLERCAVFLGSDSGPRHLANAAGLPVFFVRNLGTSEVEAGSYAVNECDIAPRGEYLSPAAAARALAAIDPDAVARALVDAAGRREATYMSADTHP